LGVIFLIYLETIK